MKPKVVRVYFDEVSEGCVFTSSPDMPELKLAGDKGQLIEEFPQNLEALFAARGESVTVRHAEMNESDALTLVVWPNAQAISDV